MVMETRATAGAAGATDHGALTGLSDDDHSQYSLVDGSRDFTGVVIGVDPTLAQHLTTKNYVDAIIADDIGFTSSTGGISSTNVGDALREIQDEVTDINAVTDHGVLTGLSDDDHTQYSLADGTRAFTGVVTGVDPVGSSDLATKNYVDSVDADSISFSSTTGGIVATNVGDVLREIQDEILDVDGSLYPLLLGRSGGQTLIGGTASGNDLVLQSTSHATKGLINLDNYITVLDGSADPGWSTASQAIQFSPRFSIGVATVDNVGLLLHNLYYDETDYRYIVTSTATRELSGFSGGWLWQTAVSGTAGDVASLPIKMQLYNSGGLVLGAPTGGDKGLGTLNAIGVYDDNVLLTCYVFDQYIDGIINNTKWDSKVPDREYKDEDGKVTKTEIRKHMDMRKFKARLGGPEDPLDIDKYANHWKTKRHLTSYPNESKFDPMKGMATGSWIQRGIESDEILAILIEQLNLRVKKLEAV